MKNLIFIYTRTSSSSTFKSSSKDRQINSIKYLTGAEFAVNNIYSDQLSDGTPLIKRLGFCNMLADLKEIREKDSNINIIVYTESISRLSRDSIILKEIQQIGKNLNIIFIPLDYKEFMDLDEKYLELLSIFLLKEKENLILKLKSNMQFFKKSSKVLTYGMEPKFQGQTSVYQKYEEPLKTYYNNPENKNKSVYKKQKELFELGIKTKNNTFISKTSIKNVENHILGLNKNKRSYSTKKEDIVERSLEMLSVIYINSEHNYYIYIEDKGYWERVNELTLSKVLYEK